MSSTQMVCGVCEETTSSFFIAIGDKLICNKCKNNHKSINKAMPQRPREFTRYLCDTHNVGTYNINNLYKHEMKDCELRSETTLGIIRPATFGGMNGDISRKYFLGINEMDRLRMNLNNYVRFVYIHGRRMRGGKKISYADKKYYNKHMGFISAIVYPDFLKNNELFKRLMFHLSLYNQTVNEKIRQSNLSSDDRNKMYYSDLMSNFSLPAIQVK